LEETLMKKLVLAALFATVFVAPAFADDQYTLVKDTVGNCSAVVAGGNYPGMTVISSDAYPSMDAANKALGDAKDCSGLVR
jgi:hypothetical protein